MMMEECVGNGCCKNDGLFGQPMQMGSGKFERRSESATFRIHVWLRAKHFQGQLQAVGTTTAAEGSSVLATRHLQGCNATCHAALQALAATSFAD